MERDSLVGTWRLLSFDLVMSTGQISYPYGEGAVGYLIYSEDGYMSTNIMRVNRPRSATEYFNLASPEEKLAAADGYLAYGGWYEIRGDRVIHHVEVSLFPNWVGGIQERLFEVTAHRLKLTTLPLMVFGIQSTSHLVWERVQ